MVLLAALGFIGRGPDKGNSPRTGWLIGAVDKPLWTSASPEPAEPAEDGTDAAVGPALGPGIQDVTEPVEPATASPVDADVLLAIAILSSLMFRVVAIKATVPL